YHVGNIVLYKTREKRSLVQQWRHSPRAALVSHLAVAAAEMDRVWTEDESPSTETLRPGHGDDLESPRWFWGANRGRREARRSSSDSERPVAVRAPVLVRGSSFSTSSSVIGNSSGSGLRTGLCYHNGGADQWTGVSRPFAAKRRHRSPSNSEASFERPWEIGFGQRKRAILALPLLP
ncbi:unnamed protein product, partial [Closterium sp. NIES-54]